MKLSMSEKLRFVDEFPQEPLRQDSDKLKFVGQITQ